MATCPAGHDSLSDDYCDICGMRIGGAPSTVPAPAAASGAAEAAPAESADQTCPQCGSPKSPGAFCEVCGFNFASGPPPAPAVPAPTAPAPAAPAPAAPPDGAPSSPTQSAWSAVVAADRGYYDQMQAISGDDGSDIPFPAYCPERRFQLTGAEMRIGRRSPSRGLNPEIDLTGPPTDPGISRLHAVLMSTSDGWTVLDPGSANGTQVNGTDIATSEQVPLHDGDRISLGAWTTITIHTT